MRARIADSGLPRREHQGPRPSVTMAGELARVLRRRGWIDEGGH